MTRARAVRRAGAVAAAALCLVLAHGPARPADAQSQGTENRVVVVVDPGGQGEVKKVCVRFSEVSISGEEALRRAGVDPVFSDYGGMGKAVCALCGVGCSDPSNCFCDERRYWAYWRAPPGGDYTRSSVGASGTELRDGDVEGWRWGGGERPSVMASVVEVCGGPAPATRSHGQTTTTTGAPSRTTAASSPTTSPAGTVPPGSAATGPDRGVDRAAPSGAPAGAEGETPAASVPPSTSSANGEVAEAAPTGDREVTEPGGGSRSAAPERLAMRSRDRGGGQSALPVVLFVALLAGIGSATVRARRRRRPAGG